MSEVEITPPEGAAAEESGVLKAIGIMLLGIFLISCMDAMLKWLGENYSTIQIVFFRSCFAFVPVGVALYHKGSLAHLKTKRPFGHLARAVIGLAALSLFVWGLTLLPLASVIAISFAAPIFVTALSVPLLREKVGARRWTAVFVGFLGVLVMVRPGGELFQWAALVVLGAVALYSLMIILVRNLGRTESASSIVFFYSVFSSVISGVLLPFFWVTPSMLDLMVLIGTGLIGGSAQLAITSAYSRANVAIIAPFEYSAMLWAVIFGFFVFAELPGIEVWMGAPIVVASGLYIALRESKLDLRRAWSRRFSLRR
jgi:drug/metabolite transporter (DMT)-like permease